MIPKIIHQIWIGPNKRPDIWMDTVQNFCMLFGYEYKLWDNTAVENFPLVNRAEYDMINLYCGKADILRYEILHTYGGIYIDADSRILKNDKLDQLISEFDDDCGFGYEIDGERLCNGVILAKPNSKFLKICIDNLASRDVLREHPWITIGPMYITELYNKYKDEIKVKTYQKTIFYPVQWQGITDLDIHERVYIPDESVMFQYGYSTNLLTRFFDTNIAPSKSTSDIRIPTFIFNRYKRVHGL